MYYDNTGIEAGSISTELKMTSKKEKSIAC